VTYATQSDLVTRFGDTELIQLTDRQGTVGEIDSAVVDRALLDADAEIDGYLAARYALPLASVPRLVLGAACDIARYRLYDDRATEQVTRRYEDAIKLLKLIAEGKVQLGLDAAAQPVVVAGGPQAEGADRVFSRDLLADYGG
jgi:phage gp36-like protein